MYSILFHEDIFMPEGVQHAVQVLEMDMHSYIISKHLEEHLQNQKDEDRSHTFFRNAVINHLNEMASPNKSIRTAFEVELSRDYFKFKKSGWFVTKYCFRAPYDSRNDIAFVVRPVYNEDKVTDYLIVTAWLNSKKDNHKTLNVAQYVDEKAWIDIRMQNNFNIIN